MLLMNHRWCRKLLIIRHYLVLLEIFKNTKIGGNKPLKPIKPHLLL
jgi:hypothetical protein